MNDEIGNFIVKFTTEGLADIKNGLKDISKGVDDLNKSFKEGESSGGSFFGSLVKWTAVVGTLTAAFVGLRNVIRGVFDTAGDVVDLYRQEQLLGVEARVLEKYGVVARRLGGSQSDVYSFFKDINTTMLNYQEGKLDEGYLEDMARLGMSFQYNPNASLSANRSAYMDALRTAFQNAGPEQKTRMDKFIKSPALRTLFEASDEDFKSLLDWGEKYSVLSKNPNTLNDAQKLQTVQIEWQQVLTDFRIQLMPILTEVLVALRPLIPVIHEQIKKLGGWVDKHADDLAKWVEDGVNWIITNGPNILKAIGDVCTAVYDVITALAPVISWAVNDLGGSLEAGWDTLKKWFGYMSDSEYENKYLTPGSSSGGFLGRMARSIAGIPSGGTVPSTRSSVTNYGANVTVQPGTYSRPVQVQPDGTAIIGGTRQVPNFVTLPK